MVQWMTRTTIVDVCVVAVYVTVLVGTATSISSWSQCDGRFVVAFCRVVQQTERQSERVRRERGLGAVVVTPRTIRE